MLLCSEPSLLINIEKGWSLFSSKTFDPPFSLLDHTYLPCFSKAWGPRGAVHYTEQREEEAAGGCGREQSWGGDLGSPGTRSTPEH